MSSRKNIKSFAANLGKSNRPISSKAISKASRATAQARIRAAPSKGAMVKRVQQGKDTGFVDLANANYNLDTTGSLTLIATVPLGTNTSSRVGKKIEWKGIQTHGYMVAGTTGTIQDATVLLVYDSQPQAALPALTLVLNTISSASFNNDSNSGRFRILRRWDMTFIGNSATPATGREAYGFDEYIKVKKPAVFQNAGTGAIGDISTGALYLIACGNQAAGTAAPILNASFRTRFIDTP